MTTPAELIEFAQRNGVYIAPYRDPVDWVENINTIGGGHCLCDSRRTCPCPESLEEIQEAINEGRAEEATCVCSFYCSKEHYDKYAKEGKKASKSSRKSQVSDQFVGKMIGVSIDYSVEPVVNIREVRSPDVRRIINTLQNVKNLLVQQRPDDAIQLIEEELDNQGCELCIEFLKEIIMRIRLATLTCTMGADICGYDVMALYNRISELERLYFQVDNEISREKSTQPPAPVVGYGDAYHQCLSELLSSDIAKQLGLSRREKFALLSSYCAQTAAKGKPYSVEDAIAFYQKKRGGASEESENQEEGDAE